MTTGGAARPRCSAYPDGAATGLSTTSWSLGARPTGGRWRSTGEGTGSRSSRERLRAITAAIDRFVGWVAAASRTDVPLRPPPFRAEHIGSLLRPPALLAARRAAEEGRLSAEALRVEEDRHIRDAVRLQEGLGLEVVTDGEYRRGIFFGHFGAAVSGFTEMDAEMSFRGAGGEPLRYRAAVVTGRLVRQDPDELRRRIDAATRLVPLERLALSPQCGFASTAPGNPLSPDEQRRKLELVVDVARRVWG